jgi:hypothetical protein
MAPVQSLLISRDLYAEKRVKWFPIQVLNKICKPFYGLINTYSGFGTIAIALTHHLRVLSLFLILNSLFGYGGFLCEAKQSEWQ